MDAASAPSTHSPLAPQTQLPQKGIPHELLLSSMQQLRSGDADWYHGKCFSLVYHASDEHSAFLKAAHNTFFEENGLNPMAFQSLKRMESEVVRMAATLFHGDDKTCGTMTSGGTESLLMATKTARDWAKKKKPWILRPEIVVPSTVHVAFDKACHYFGLRLRRVAVGPDMRADVRATKRAINRNTVMMVASAPQYPHGVVDPIEELGAIAQDKEILFHVDACVGGFILPFLERLGRTLPTWDFRVPGVTSISADLHKYGYTAKGASVIVYRSMEVLRHQFFIGTEFPGGVYASPTMPGTRPGGTIAAAWAGLLALGEAGYLSLAKKTVEAADALRAGISKIDGLTLLGVPHATIVTYTSSDKAIDIYAVADQIEDRGWHVDRQQKPPCIHLTVTANHAQVVDAYLRDLRDSVAFVRAHPDVKSRGNAAMYGMMAKVPFRSMVKGAVQKIMEDMYGPGGKQPDLKKAPDGLVGKVMDKYGERALGLLDKMEDLKTRLGGRR